MFKKTGKQKLQPFFFNAEQSYTEIYFSMNAIESNSAVTYSKTTVTRTFDEHWL